VKPYVVLVIVAAVLIYVVAEILSGSSTAHQPAPITKGPSYNDAAEPETGVAQAANPLGQDWRVVSVQSRITQENRVAVEYAWKVTVQNDSDGPSVFSGRVKFLDKDGFQVSDDTVNFERVPIAAHSKGEFTGQREIFNEPASRIVKVIAAMEKELQEPVTAR
jgi:hypothetical protein